MATAFTRYEGNMLFQTEVGGQHITTDVTPPMGGKGRAPTPPDLFVASLGACVAAFVAHYCEQEGMDTNGITAETFYEKTEKPVHLTNFRIDVRLPHAELGDREAAVQRVADHCIIHETLHQLRGIQIRIHDARDLPAA
jgi:putative redox protein